MLAENRNNRLQPSTLLLGPDLPYFPGKMGVDFFNLRYLAQTQRISVVGPKYEILPAEGIANLEKTAHKCYFWPEKVALGPITTEPFAERVLKFPFTRLPAELLKKVWSKVVSIDNRPPDTFLHLRVMSNLAPYLVAALREQKPDTIVLLQSSTEPWLKFLPGFAARFVYFHDIKADFEEKRQVFQQNNSKEKLIEHLKLQEKALLDHVDGAAFVSERDQRIAERLYNPVTPMFVAPIPIDTDYYSPSAASKTATQRSVVLFTGHLGHPPNVDAISFFLQEIWPVILKRLPNAEFITAGCFPDPRVAAAVQSAENAQLHPNVPDIRPFFEQATVYVVPMRFGGGVRQKILEAWSMRKPVIATSMATEGIKVRQGEQLWLEDTPDGFAERVIDLLKPHLDIDGMTERNRRFVQQHYSIEVAASSFANAINSTRARIRQRPLKVFFDLRWMRIGYAGGIEQLVYELASTISKLDSTNEYRFYGPRSALLDWQFPRSFQHKFFFSDLPSQQMRDFRYELMDALALATGNPRFMNREMRFLRFVNDLDFDLIHSFQGFTYPEFERFPSIVTVPDLQHLTYPSFFSKDAYTIREKLFRKSVENANHIICISQFTLEEVYKHYGVPREKMSVVWVTPSRASLISLQPLERARVLVDLGIRSQFVFYPAHNWPHKNHERLFMAFRNARRRLPADMKLILTGGRLDPVDGGVDLHDIISRLNLESSVLHLGYVTQIQLCALYASATALVFPSLFEGFGMPVAEAILSGCPVACSETTSLPEIAGDAALFFDPSNSDEISAALVNICTDEAVRDGLKLSALRRRSAFSSFIPAIQTMSIYRKVMDERFS
jgi:glycosyltransferase involved in cell wall biosynthesis